MPLKAFNKKIILGSASPRRKELLEGLGLQFEILPSNVNEDYDASLAPFEIAEYLAIKKSIDFSKLSNNEIYISCDTLVYCNGEILNKPKDAEEGIGMLKYLSDKTHQVYTGVCLRSNNKTVSFWDQTNVTFRPLSEESILYYVNKFRPFDKAGAYAIQEWIGFIGVEKIEGCYYNVMGMPLSKVWKALQEF